MDIISRMTGIAVFWSAYKNMISMTILAGYAGMFPCKYESGQIMIELRWGPTAGGMARSAIDSISALVRVFFLVAGVAVLRGGL